MSFGIGLMIAGKVVEKQEWFGEDFGKALMIGGAIASVSGFSPFESGEALNSVDNSVSALNEGATASDLGLDQAFQAGVDGTAVASSAGTDLAGESLFKVGADGALSSGVSSGFNPAMVTPSELGAAELSSTNFITPTAPNYLAGSAETGLLDNGIPDINPELSFWDKMSPQAQMGTMMVGGQAASGMASSMKMEKMEKKKREEAERIRLAQTRWGQRTGGGGVKLNVGQGLTEMNNRFFNNRASRSNQGLLS